jgi:hypothetical protein
MHWAAIPIAEFQIPASSGPILSDRDAFRMMSRASRKGFWLSAVFFVVLAATGYTCVIIGQQIIAAVCFVLSVAGWVVHTLSRREINLALWISREPAAVYWAEPETLIRKLGKFRLADWVLRFHTPAPMLLEVTLSDDDLTALIEWLHQGNPNVLIGTYSPADSDGRLSGGDPWARSM